MKGVILAGGHGTRLRPLTRITNKHLLPVYDRPMILYPLETLKNSGITDIMIVCGKDYAGHFVNFLGSGVDYGVRISYAIQSVDGAGIADALSHARDFVRDESVAVILGDNVFESSFSGAIKKFTGGTTIFLKKVKDPRRFGVAVFSKDKKQVIKIEEKPKIAKSPFGQVGFYIFDKEVFSIIDTLVPSKRNELEIADAVNEYIKQGRSRYEIIKGFWSDVGTFDSWMRTKIWLYRKKKNDQN